MHSSGRSWLAWIIGALALLGLGADSVHPPVPVPAAPACTYDLKQLLELATVNHPDITIARTRAEAARGRMIQAGLYPNPRFVWEAEDMNNPDNRAGAQGPVISQDIVTSGKLRKARRAASFGVAAADWQATTRWYDVVTRTRLAYFDVLSARQEVVTAEAIAALAREGRDAAQHLLKSGTGVQPDVLRALVELDQSTVQVTVARQRLLAAGELLAAAVGQRELPMAAIQGTFPEHVPHYEWRAVLDMVLGHSSQIQEAQSAVLQAEELYRLAKAERIPNLSVAARPLYNFPDHQREITVFLGANIPLFNRNQGNIRAAEADIARTMEEVRQVELRLQERLATVFQRYQTARDQVEVYQKQVLPNAIESVRLVRIGYERGDPKYDFTTWLQVQRTLAQARLILVQAQNELWRSISDLAGLLQYDDLLDNCAGPQN